MSDIHWNTLIVECEEPQTIKPASELCSKQRVGILIVPPDQLDNALVGRGLLKAGYQILTKIDNPEQKTPGADKLIGSHADVFDAEGFQITPLATDNAAVLLQDLRLCSEFLRGNLSQELIIGWDLSNIQLKDKDTLALFDMIAKGYRPNFLRFNGDQGLICEIAKKACATKTVLPFDVDLDSDYHVISASKAVKLAK